MIDDARPSEMPGFIKPQLASLRSKAPAGDKWLHEIKYDGYRIQIHLNGGRRKVYTRNGLDQAVLRHWHCCPSNIDFRTHLARLI
jgi:ATP-dependent DNA ligase